MQRVIENILNALDRLPLYAKKAKEIVQEEAKGNGWIYCRDEMPPVEKEVFVLTKRKFSNNTFKYVCTTALYEDGTIRENDSCWNWEDVDGEWDEEEDCLIIPEGWWEYRHFNADGVLNNAIDCEVIAWQPMPSSMSIVCADK